MIRWILPRRIGNLGAARLIPRAFPRIIPRELFKDGKISHDLQPPVPWLYLRYLGTNIDSMDSPNINWI